MGTFILGTLGGLMLVGCAAIYAKQILIDEARSRTDGYF